MELKNKKIIVTGAASGIGKELTRQLLMNDAFVCAVDINKESLENLKEEFNSDRLFTYVVDVSNKESIESFKEAYLKNHEFVDILINNAGIVQPFKSVAELTDQEIMKVMNINFFGVVNFTKTFLNNLITRKEGYIVNISSMGGFFPFPKQSIYGASKAAVKLFTEGLYSELLNTNVKVMVVFPGAIETNILKNSNVSYNTNDENGTYKMLSPKIAASQIINGIIRNKFKLYVGNDSKFMNLIYKINSKSAIKFINNKMRN